jgi:hypothetical protein
MIREKSSYSFLRSLVKCQDHSFFKDLKGVFCTVGGTLVGRVMSLELSQFKGFYSFDNRQANQRLIYPI